MDQDPMIQGTQSYGKTLYFNDLDYHNNAQPSYQPSVPGYQPAWKPMQVLTVVEDDAFIMKSQN